MKINILLFTISTLCLTSCSKDNNDYPKSFKFNHSTIKAEQGFVIGDNETYTQISSKAGNLDSLRSLLAVDLYGFIKNDGGLAFIESLDLLSKDSVRLTVWFGDTIQSATFPALIDDPDGLLIDPFYFDGGEVKYDSNHEEISICLAIGIGIVKRGGHVFAQINGNYCDSNDAIHELEKILLSDDYVKNDTMGVYVTENIYK